MCCCPGAISALFCLWCQSGCSKGTVAGALTFFPPEPALYQFERRDKNGKILAEREEAGEDESKVMDGHDLELNDTNDDDGDGDGDDQSGALGEMEAPGGSGSVDIETKGQTKEKLKSPIEQLTDQAAARRKRAKSRNARDARDATKGVTYKLLLDPRLQVPPYEERCIDALKIPSFRGVHIATVVYRVLPSRVSSSTKTIIYSHGNATDIGAMFPIQVVLAHSLDCNVVVYDYSGYGESGGVPMECNTYRDIKAVYDYVLDELADGEPTNIILYGQSVGSGPCCHLAASEGELGGMILHSPFTSGMRVLTPSRLLACLDIYPNIDRIKNVNCPVMLIHGQLDQEVDISHGLDLHRSVPSHLQRHPWWVKDRGHNDITEGPGKLAEYIRRVRTFMNSLEEDAVHVDADDDDAA